jgi:hypothetical protein
MVSLSQLVNESLARHGVETDVDHRRLQWSKWFPLESNFEALVAPSKPGIFALAAPMAVSEQLREAGDRDRLALLQISQTEDIGMALGRLFLPSPLEAEHLALGRCYARYAIVEDGAQRQSAYLALQRSMASPEKRFLAAGAESRAGGNVWGLEASDGSPPPPIDGRAPMPSSS